MMGGGLTVTAGDRDWTGGGESTSSNKLSGWWIEV